MAVQPKRLAQKEHLLQKLAHFEPYWNSFLSVCIKNARAFSTYPRKPSDNWLLNELVTHFMSAQININLLRFYEAVDMLESCGAGWEEKPQAVRRLVDYRNALITHFEAKRRSGEPDVLLQKIHSQPGLIYEEIEEGFEILISKIRSLNIVVDQSSQVAKERQITYSDIDQMLFALQK